MDSGGGTPSKVKMQSQVSTGFAASSDSPALWQDQEEDQQPQQHPPHQLPRLEVHSPEGYEEKPLFDEDVIVPLVELPPPPDGGWGWVVCVSSFMCNLILDGIAYTFGVLLEPLVRSFDSNRSTVSLVGSLLVGVYLTSGPIVGGLVNKYGCRPVCIAGAVVSCLGLALSTLSTNVAMLMVTYGVIGGFGLGLVYLPAVVAVGYYFEKRRALATGISVCGSGVGTFLFAPLATWLLDVYGWRGANLIFAGLCLNCAVFGALMRPLELTVRTNEEEDFEDPVADGDAYTVQLPDGTQHHNRQFSHESDDDKPMSMTFQGSEEAVGAASTSIQAGHLPTIAETSVTKGESTDRPSVRHIFPENAGESTPMTPELQHQHSVPNEKPRRGFSRRRISGGLASKFQVTPVRHPIPRNSTAPNFVDPTGSSKMPRNSSTPGFGRLARLHSQPSSEGPQEYIIFGIHGDQILSNNTLHLEPLGSSKSRRGSRATVRPLYRKDVFYAGSVSHLIHQEGQHSRKMSQHPSFVTLNEYRHSIISIPRSRRQSTASIPRSSIVASHLSIPVDVRKASCVPGEALEDDEAGDTPITTGIREMSNFQLLANPYFILLAFSNILGMLGFYTPFVYLPSMVMADGGVGHEQASFLISLIGVSNTLGRVVAGWISDFECVNPLVVTNLAIFMSGVCCIVFPWCGGSYAAYVFVALVFGAAVAAYISLTSIVLVDLMGLDNLTSAFGLLVLFRGVSSTVGSPLAGFIFDVTESYATSFYISGLMLVAAAVVSEVADLLHRRNARVEKRKAKKQQKE